MKNPTAQGVKKNKGDRPKGAKNNPPNIPASSSASFMPEPQKMEVSRPYIITIKNSTYELIKDFSLNNLHQALKAGEKFDSRVYVEYGLKHYSYLEFLQSMQTTMPTIGRMRIDSIHDYPKYQTIQLNKPIIAVSKNADGSTFTSPIFPYTALNQFITTSNEVSCNIQFKDGWDLLFTLMPEAEIRISLFPSSAINLSRLLDTKNIEKCVQDFEKPQIGAIQTIRLTSEPTKVKG